MPVQRRSQGDAPPAALPPKRVSKRQPKLSERACAEEPIAPIATPTAPSGPPARKPLKKKDLAPDTRVSSTAGAAAVAGFHGNSE